ncbi:hypothetical protein LguiA_003885 [Lonicera macranthoides]
MVEGSVLPENCGSGCGETTVSVVNSGGEEGDRSSGVNRWPREETLALLKIRSDMDVDFRDSNLKGALWDDVSRKLGELGYHRSAKKCREKFENIYKYHKRTKEGRSGRQNGKNYRFFDQLEVFDHHSSSLPSPPLDKTNQNFTAERTMAVTNLYIKPANVTEENVLQENIVKNPSCGFMSTSTSATSNSSKESAGDAKKKRKLEAYFESLMKEVLEKQESLQNKFIEAIEKSETERAAREEAWKMQEMARAKKEKEILAQERAVSAAKDAAVIAFLQKISDQANPLVQLQENQVPIEKNVEKHLFGIGNGNGTSSSRWPRVEVEDLIRLRTNLDYQDNGAKGSLWEEISSAMKKLGYDRSAKRCKEKWENINKYYKRVKESNKKRPEDSKTCPYFHMLESIYEMKSKKGDGSGYNLKAEDILMQMMGHQQQEQSMTDNGESENADQNEEEDGEEENDDDDNGDDYQVVVNNNNNTSSTMATME